MEKNEELESVEFVRGKLVKNDPPLSSPESIPRLINYIDYNQISRRFSTILQHIRYYLL